MKTYKKAGLVLVASLAAGLAFSIAARPQARPEVAKPYEHLIYSVKGPDLYRTYCAACHGLSGRGDGPVASALKATPANLTMLAKNNGGKFPDARAGQFISGEELVAAHGTREMPVWGPIFHQIEEDQDFGNVRMQNLIKYLETIQQK